MPIIKSINSKKNEAMRNIKKNILVAYLNKVKKQTSLNPLLVKNILLLRIDDKIGDMVITTGTAKLLADNGYHISILTGPACHLMLSTCDYLHNVFLYQKRMDLTELRNINFDVIIDFDDVRDYERLRLIWKINAHHNIGFNKDEFNLYDTSISFINHRKHISERHKKALALFGIDAKEFNYHLGECRNSREIIFNNLKKTENKIIISINPFTASRDKDISESQTIAIINYIKKLNPENIIIIIGQESKVNIFRGKNVHIIPRSTINTAIEIVRASDLVISADTSVVHIAKALDKNLISIYNKRKLKDTGLPGYETWAPDYKKAKQIIINENNIFEYEINNLFPVIKESLDKISAYK